MLVKPTTPPCGWNSYDCYGSKIDEEAAKANLAVFIEKLKPAGYEYFVLDAGWYGRYAFKEFIERKAEGKGQEYFCDEWGRHVSSPTLFPHGIRALSDACHAAGIKFGVHLMRGIPTVAVEKNTPVKGHPTAHARDIVDVNHQCKWCDYYRAIDIDKPGAKEFYQSEADYLLDDLQVDFVKLDDATPYPREVQIFAEALDRNPRPVVLSLSPGNSVTPVNWNFYARYAAMMRCTGDVWDRPEDNNMKFDRWFIFDRCCGNGSWIDLDMLPLGSLQVNVPESTPDADAPLGKRRACRLSPMQKRVLMTQMALAPSPLFFGGDLPTSSDDDIALATDPDMLECNRDGAFAKQVFFQRHIDIRRMDSVKNPGHGWIGLFSREWGLDGLKHESFTMDELGFSGSGPDAFFDVWEKKMVRPIGGRLELDFGSYGCFLLKF